MSDDPQRYLEASRDIVMRLLSDFHSFEPGVRDRAIAALHRFDRETIFTVLGELLQESDPNVRADAAESLIRIDSIRALELVMPLLEDPVSSVRWYVCGLLHDRGDSRATAALVQVLTQDADGDVRWTAAFALGNTGDASAILALRRAIAKDRGTDREGRRIDEAAANAIESIQDRYSSM